MKSHNNVIKICFSLNQFPSSIEWWKLSHVHIIQFVLKLIPDFRNENEKKREFQFEMEIQFQASHRITFNYSPNWSEKHASLSPSLSLLQ